MRALYHHRTQGKGVEAVHIHGLCAGLNQLGFQTEVVGPPGVHTNPNLVVDAEKGKSGTPWGWIARHLPQFLFECAEMGYNVVALPRLWMRYRTAKPTLIYERYALYNMAGTLIAGLTRTPLILEVNDTVDVDRTRQGKTLKMRRLARWFEKRIFYQASGIVVVSGYLRDKVIAAGGSSERIRITPNAVDATCFDPERVDTSAVRKRYQLSEHPVIGFAGSFAKWHRVDLLVRAFAEVSREFPDARLLLIGDGALRAETEALVAELEQTGRVIFTGKIPHAEIPAHMAAMDIGVMPESNNFGSPMKVFEYMAMGCVPVAPRYGPLEEALEDGVHGLLFPPGDGQALADCLRTLIADPKRRCLLSAAAQHKVRTQHQWQHNAQAVLELVARNEQILHPSNRTETSRGGNG